MPTFRITEILFSSNGTCVFYDGSATSDALIPSPSFVSEEAMLGVLFPEPFALKTVSDSRWELRANASSNLTIAWLDDLGGLNSTASTTLTVPRV